MYTKFWCIGILSILLMPGDSYLRQFRFLLLSLVAKHLSGAINSKWERSCSHVTSDASVRLCANIFTVKKKVSSSLSSLSFFSLFFQLCSFLKRRVKGSGWKLLTFARTLGWFVDVLYFFLFVKECSVGISTPKFPANTTRTLSANGECLPLIFSKDQINTSDFFMSTWFTAVLETPSHILYNMLLVWLTKCVWLCKWCAERLKNEVYVTVPPVTSHKKSVKKY